MLFFDLLKLWEPGVSPKNAKVHLARFNGVEHPLDVFIAGNFDSWQSWQSAKNFEKEYLVSLVQAGTPTRWLFAGLFKPTGREDVGGELGRYRYSLARVEAAESWVGRAYLTSAYKQRNSYPLATTLAPDLRMVELLPERVSIGQFPGYKSVDLTKEQLDVVVRQNISACVNANRNLHVWGGRNLQRAKPMFLHSLCGTALTNTPVGRWCWPEAPDF